jgi:predicted MFS family arabinose efflux permease
MYLRLSIPMFLQWAIPGALVPLYSVRLRDVLGFDELTVAACCATQAAASVVSSLIVGQVADRWWPAEKAMSACAGVAGLALWLLAGADRPVTVFFLTLLFWSVTGPMLLLGTTICFTHLTLPSRQFGPIRMWGTVGWMVSGWLIGGWLADPAWLEPVRLALRPEAPPARIEDACRLGAVLAVVLAAYALSLPATPPGARRRIGTARWLAPLEAARLLRSRSFAIYFASMLGACITFAFSTQSTPLLLCELGVDASWVSTTLTLAQFTEVVLLAFLPWFLLRLGICGTMRLGLAAWLAAMSLLAVGRPLSLVIASLALNGVFITGFLITGQVYLNSVAHGDLRASVQGLFSFINGLGQLLGNLLAGWLRHETGGEVPSTFAVAALITAVILGLFLTGFRPEPWTFSAGPQDVQHEPS